MSETKELGKSTSLVATRFQKSPKIPHRKDTKRDLRAGRSQHAGGTAATSGPFHLRRQRRQDGLHIAAGLQPECGAAVVEQVELDIAPAPDQLLVAIRV